MKRFRIMDYYHGKNHLNFGAAQNRRLAAILDLC